MWLNDTVEFNLASTGAKESFIAVAAHERLLARQVLSAVPTQRCNLLIRRRLIVWRHLQTCHQILPRTSNAIRAGRVKYLNFAVKCAINAAQAQKHMHMVEFDFPSNYRAFMC